MALQIAGLPGRWFRAAAAPVQDALLRDGYSEAEAALDIGDSAVIESASEQPAAPGDATSSSPGNPPGASEQSATPDPLALLDPAERPVAEKIRDLLAAKPAGIFASNNERAAVESFYRGRNFASLWLDKGVENARAKTVIARVRLADTDGLDKADYRIPNLAGASPDALAEADIKLTQTVLTFARHLQAGRFPYNRLSRNIQLPQVPPDPAAISSHETASWAIWNLGLK